MMRALFWIALIVLVVFAIRSKLRGAATRQPGPAARERKEGEGEVEAMACCAHCGLHFPASEAVRADGLDYCSPAHVRLPPQ
jgi:uncharacterized protein